MSDLEIDAHGDLASVEPDFVEIVERIWRSGTQATRLPRVFRHEWVPLTRTNTETGETEDALFWKIDGDIYVHPDRWDAFVEGMQAAGVVFR